MNLADKIITLRKKNGWSQEELADRLDVSRQSVSKWEGAQSMPDIDKILAMSRIFGVSTDYLLKEDTDETKIDRPARRLVSMEEARDFLALRRAAAKQIATGTLLCILSPLPLVLLGWLHERMHLLSEDIAAGAGLAALLVMISIACGLFISCGMKVKPYEYLETDEFDTEYGVVSMVRQLQKTFLPTYTRCNCIGTMLCILCGIPLFLSAGTGTSTFWGAIGVMITLPTVAYGVFCFIYGGVNWAAMQKLLQEDDYTPINKRISKKMNAVSSVFWLITTACYLAWSFLTYDWYVSWIIWPVNGLLYAALSVGMRQFFKNQITRE